MPWLAPVSEIPLIKDLRTLVVKLARWLADLVRGARYYEIQVPLGYGSTVRPVGSRSGVQLITVTDGNAFTVAAPGNAREGFILTLDFLNSSQGTLGAVTFDSAYVLDGAFVAPDIDQTVSYRFLRHRDGKWREIERSRPAAPTPGNPPPTAGFTVSKSNLVVTVTDTSTDVAPGTIVGWNYDWGDNTADSTTQNPSHTYAASGTYTITQTVTDNGGATATTTRPVTVTSVGGTLKGVPFGLFNLFATTTTLQPNTDMFTMSQDGYTASNIIARLDAAKSLGIGVVLAMTGGGRSRYLTNGIFDRSKWTAIQQSYNTTAIKNAITAARAVMNCCVASVMDEPGNDGGPANESNAWGPAGTMSKAGATFNNKWNMTVSGARAISATQITITPGLANPLPNGTLLTFLPGHGKTAILNGSHAAGVTSLTVLGLPAALANGDTSFSNSVDNLVQECKNIFGDDFPVGCFLDYTVFKSQSFLVCDFIMSQYRWAKSNGDVQAYIDGALALGVRDGHKIAFALNLLDGGIRGSSGGCPDVWICGDNTGGRGSYCPNCNVTPQQAEDWGKALGENGVFLTGFKYFAGFMDKPANQTALRRVRDYLATIDRPDPHR